MHVLCKAQGINCSRCTFELVCYWSDDFARLQGQEQQQEQKEGELKVC